MPQYDIDLRDYWRIIKRRKAVIALMVLLVGVCSYGFAKLKEPTPMFRASTTIKIEQTTNMVSFFTGGLFAQTGRGPLSHKPQVYVFYSHRVSNLLADKPRLGYIHPQ